MNEHLKIIEKIKEPTSYPRVNNKNPSFRYFYIIETKYGLCKMLSHDYDRGFIPNIKSAVNRTEYFINECIEKHGIFYDYSLVNYKKAHDNIEIICPVHGKFEQKAYSHKQGIGCPICTDKGDKQEIINKLKAKSVIGVNMNTKTYYISKSLGAFRKIGINEGIIERAIKGKYDKYNMYWFYICDVDIDKLKDQGFIEVYKI